MPTQLSLSHNQLADFISDTFHPNNIVTLYLGDRLDLLSQIAATHTKTDLILTSPPYNMGKAYESQLSLADYLTDQEKTISACVDILSETGSVCWQVGHYLEYSGKNKESFPLDIVLYPLFKKFGLILRNRIIWTFGHGLHEKYRFSGRHETILWFTRPSPDYTFNLDPVRIPQKYPNKRAFRGSNKGQLSGNPLGKNPSDIWDIPNVKSNHVEKTAHPCQFPVALAERLVLALSNENDLIVDPYIGSGSTAVAAFLHHRRAAGSDIFSNYLNIAKDRLLSASLNSLPIRPLNKPVYSPPSEHPQKRLFPPD